MIHLKFPLFVHPNMIIIIIFHRTDFCTIIIFLAKRLRKRSVRVDERKKSLFMTLSWSLIQLWTLLSPETLLSLDFFTAIHVWIYYYFFTSRVYVKWNAIKVSEIHYRFSFIFTRLGKKATKKNIAKMHWVRERGRLLFVFSLEK